MKPPGQRKLAGGFFAFGGEELMAKDAVYKGRREVRTFVDLAHGADVLIRTAQNVQKGSYYTIMGALLLTAFEFEAYLNHLGAKRFRFWDEVESIRVMDKYALLCKELELEPDFSRRPYQTLRALFKFRNSIAHGKSQVLEEFKPVNADDDPYEHAPRTHWEEFCTLENAERSKHDIDEIVTELNVEAGLGKYPFLSGMTIGSIRLK